MKFAYPTIFRKVYFFFFSPITIKCYFIEFQSFYYYFLLLSGDGGSRFITKSLPLQMSEIQIKLQCEVSFKVD